MYNITQADIDFEKVIDSQLSYLEGEFEKNFFAQEATLELLSFGVAISGDMNYISNKLIWNVACFINISSYDLKLITRSMIITKREWEKRLFARQACLLIYETLNDFFDLLGKDFRRIIATLKENQIYIAEVKSIVKELNVYKATYFEKLKLIRNVSIAHREKDTTEQLKIIHSISWSESMNLISAFDKILNRAGSLLQELISKTKELENIE